MYLKSLESCYVKGARKRSIKHTHSQKYALIQNLVGLEKKKIQRCLYLW